MEPADAAQPVDLGDLLGETEADGSLTPPSLRQKRGKSLSPVLLREDCFPRHYVAVPPAGTVVEAPGGARSPLARRLLVSAAAAVPAAAVAVGAAGTTTPTMNSRAPERPSSAGTRPAVRGPAMHSASAPNLFSAPEASVSGANKAAAPHPTAAASSEPRVVLQAHSAGQDPLPAASGMIEVESELFGFEDVLSFGGSGLPARRGSVGVGGGDAGEEEPTNPSAPLPAAAGGPTAAPQALAPAYQRMAVIGEWFLGFTDQQRNDTLRLLLRHCQPAQNHLLSLLLAGRALHTGCDDHCRDPLLLLPSDLALRILTFLDAGVALRGLSFHSMGHHCGCAFAMILNHVAVVGSLHRAVSLARVARVCHAWRDLCSEPSLWRVHAEVADHRLAPASEQQQIQQHVFPNGAPDWRAIAVERIRLHRNWLRGRCTVRTFRGHEQGVLCVQLDSNRIASGSSDATIKVWNTRTNAAWSVLTLRGHLGPVRCLHMRGPLLVSGSSDHTIRVWELADGPGWRCGSCRLTITGHDDAVRCLQSDGKSIVSGSYDGTLRVWDLATGACLHVLRGHNGPVLSLYFDIDVLVSGGMDTEIKVWSIAQGACKATLTGHRGGVTCVQADVAKGRLFSGAIDGDVRFWDLATGKCVETLDWIRSEGHTGVIRQLQADQWRVVTASDDKTIKVWDLRTRTRLATLRCHTDGVTCVHFTDWALVSGSFDESVKLLDFSAC